MTMTPYRDPVLDEPAPKGLVALIWRWWILRRADRMEREHRQMPQLSAPVPVPAPVVVADPAPVRHRVRTVHMVRDSSLHPFRPTVVEMHGCPGKGGARPDSTGGSALSYWVCTPNNCCCEILRD